MPLVRRAECGITIKLWQEAESIDSPGNCGWFASLDDEDAKFFARLSSHDALSSIGPAPQQVGPTASPHDAWVLLAKTFDAWMQKARFITV